MEFKVIFVKAGEKVEKEFEATNALELFVVLTRISYPRIPKFRRMKSKEGVDVIPSTVLEDLKQVFRIKRFNILHIKAPIGMVLANPTDPENIVERYQNLKKQAKREDNVDIFSLLQEYKDEFHNRLPACYS